MSQNTYLLIESSGDAVEFPPARKRPNYEKQEIIAVIGSDNPQSIELLDGRTMAYDPDAKEKGKNLNYWASMNLGFCGINMEIYGDILLCPKRAVEGVFVP